MISQELRSEGHSRQETFLKIIDELKTRLKDAESLSKKLKYELDIIQTNEKNRVKFF